jgi:tetratricopeptide (TPR) repeat protein
MIDIHGSKVFARFQAVIALSVAIGTPTVVRADERACDVAPPLTLVQRLSPEAIVRLRDEAELHARARSLPSAIDAWATLASVDPGNVAAWMRLGTLHFRQQNHEASECAFRRALALAQTAPDGEVVRAKVQVNLAVLGLARVRRILDDLEKTGASATPASTREALKVEAEEVEQRLGAIRRRWDDKPFDSDEPGASDGRRAQPGPPRAVSAQETRLGRIIDEPSSPADLRARHAAHSHVTPGGPGDALPGRGVRVDYITGGPAR